MEKLKLREDMVAADFGSGSGGWAIPLARKLGKGKVLALDIQDEPLSALKAKAKLFKIENIDTVKADVEKSAGLMNESCDLVLLTNLLFECENKKKVLEETRRVLKPAGKILIVDWKSDVRLGPGEKRVDENELKEMALDLNLKIADEFEASDYHFGLILAKFRP